MSISYTENFSFPLLDSGSGGWLAVLNGMITNLDTLMAEARNPLTWDDDGDDYLLINSPTGKKPTTELLTYDGDVLLYI